MKQKFYTKTIQSDFIKSLLYNTPLPVYNTVRPGDYLIKGITYIYNRQIIKCTSSGYLCNDFRELQSWDFIEPISRSSTDLIFPPVISYGCTMENQKYYLLADYNLRYELSDESPDYPVFNFMQSYSSGDIVQYYSGSQYLLYQAKHDIPERTLWDYNDWNYVQAFTRPFILIQCTKSGVLGARPKGGSTYNILQEFEPVVLSRYEDYILDRHTYYIIKSVENFNEGKATLIYNEDLYKLDQKAAEWKIYGGYIPEYYYTKYTNNFISNIDYYDSETHLRLGELLRFYKNVYDLDLMSYYNCWDGSNLSGYQIFEDKLVETTSDQYKLIKVPIKFNKKYTIAIDSPTPVKMVPTIMNLNKFIQIQIGQSNQINLNSLLDSNEVINYASLKFNFPTTFELTNVSEETMQSIDPSVKNSNLLKAELLQRYEKNLYLIIQLEKTVTSSVVVLEGDYTNIYSRKYFNVDNLDQIHDDSLNEALMNNLSLLQFNDKTSYPFADRLVEYLLLNVINQIDPITEDAQRIRDKLSSSVGLWDYDEISWTDYLRITIFDLLMNDPIYSSKLDISGYVDKDAEYFIDTTFK